MTEQWSFDFDEGKRNRDHALQAVSSTDKAQDFDDRATPVILHLARTGEPFTTDDVWRILGPYDGERRVMGSTMRRLATKGLIQKTMSTRKSSMPACHARDKALWIGTSPTTTSCAKCGATLPNDDRRFRHKCWTEQGL